MQNPTTTTRSNEQLEKAKQHLSNSLKKLEKVISDRNSRYENEQNVKTQIITDLDDYIANLATLIKNNS